MKSIQLEEAKSCLPEWEWIHFDNIVNQVVLGASRHIKMIGAMIESICIDAKKNNESIEMLITRIDCVCEYFIQTRGEASQAISNAISLMTKDLHSEEYEKLNDKIESIIKIKNDYELINKKALDNCVLYAKSVVDRKENIFIFDYSSTVERIIMEMEPGKTVYVSESRVINGGMPFIKACIKNGHKVKFFPDASMMYYLKNCDIALMGVETFLPDGTGYNTTGSDIVGLICKYYKIPLYMVTPFIKIDIRALFGKEKKLVINDLKEKLEPIANPDNLNADIDYKTPELLGVVPEHITAFITEKGIIPSGQMFIPSLKYIKKLRGEKYV